MKFFSPIIFISIFYCSVVCAQSRSARSVHFDFIAKDSIKLAFNDDYELIEDSCSQFTRYAHINMRIGRKYVGKVKDVSRLDPNVTVLEGTYSPTGEKEGLFTTHYINGQLRAKGNFLKDEMDGKWETYYDDGKPKLFFEVSGKDITITDSWNEKGKKLVDNGKGTYKVTTGSVYWRGKLVNGRPDGTWGIYKTDDATETEMATEKFNYGVFQKGKSPIGDYTDASRMDLITPDILPFIHGELLRVSALPCNGVKAKHIVGAQYKYGMKDYSDELVKVVSAFMYYIDVKHFTNKFSIEGEVNESGYLTNLNSYDSFNQTISGGLIANLKRVVPLEPATIDGKPVKQKIKFNFTFSEGLYSFNYRFGEVMGK